MDNLDAKIFNEAARQEFKKLAGNRLIFRVPFVRRVVQKFFVDGIRFGMKEAGDHVSAVFQDMLKKGAER